MEPESSRQHPYPKREGKGSDEAPAGSLENSKSSAGGTQCTDTVDAQQQYLCHRIAAPLFKT